jgi:hypothetical protein
MNNKRLLIILRIVSAVLLIAAIAWGAEILRQAKASDDGGPPLGAIIMAVPSVILLIAAGAVWSITKKYSGNQPARRSTR